MSQIPSKLEPTIDLESCNHGPVALQGAGSEESPPSRRNGDANQTSPFDTARNWLKHPTVRRSVAQTVTVIVIIFLIEYVVLPNFAKARQSISLLGRVNIALVILAVVAEAGALLAYAELTRSVLTPVAPSRMTVLRINLSSFALSHVLPAGSATGGALGYRLLLVAGVPGTTAGFGLGVQAIGSAVVLNVIFWLALFISIPLNGFNPLYGYAALAGVVLFAVFAGTLVLLSRGELKSESWFRKVADRLPFVEADTVDRLLRSVAERIAILVKNRTVLGSALGYAALNWLLDALSLWIFVWAFGVAMNPVDLLVAYGLANILAVIPVTPGGLGVIEGVLIPTLVGFHVPNGVAVFAVLAYRLFNFWLPIPIGGASYLSLRIGRFQIGPRVLPPPELT
ncbi:MAG: YbhN family protein [Actinomycetota bacterium]